MKITSIPTLKAWRVLLIFPDFNLQVRLFLHFVISSIMPWKWVTFPSSLRWIKVFSSIQRTSAVWVRIRYWRLNSCPFSSQFSSSSSSTRSKSSGWINYGFKNIGCNEKLKSEGNSFCNIFFIRRVSCVFLWESNKTHFCLTPSNPQKFDKWILINLNWMSLYLLIYNYPLEAGIDGFLQSHFLSKIFTY